MHWQKITIGNRSGEIGYFEVPSDTKQIVLDINDNKAIKLTLDGRDLLPERDIDKLARFASMSADLPRIFEIKNDALRIDLNGMNPEGVPPCRAMIEIESREVDYSVIYLLRSEFSAKEQTPEEKLSKAFLELSRKIALQWPCHQ